MILFKREHEKIDNSCHPIVCKQTDMADKSFRRKETWIPEALFTETVIIEHPVEFKGKFILNASGTLFLFRHISRSPRCNKQRLSGYKCHRNCRFITRRITIILVTQSSEPSTKDYFSMPLMTGSAIFVCLQTTRLPEVFLLFQFEELRGAVSLPQRRHETHLNKVDLN